jgi:hypothetical protein
LWVAPRKGRKLELDGTTLGRVMTQHPDLQQVLDEPPDLQQVLDDEQGKKIVLASPRAGEYNDAGTTGYDIATALGIDLFDRVVLATTGDVRWTATGALDVRGPKLRLRRMGVLPSDGIVAITLTSATLGDFGVHYPTASDTAENVSPIERWAKKVTDQTLEHYVNPDGSIADRTEWAGGVRPYFARIGDADGELMSARRTTTKLEGVNPSLADSAPIITTQDVFSKVAASSEDIPIVLLLPDSLSPEVASQTANSLVSGLRERAYWRTVTVLKGARLMPGGRLGTPSWHVTIARTPLQPHKIDMWPVPDRTGQIRAVAFLTSPLDMAADSQFVLNMPAGGPIHYISKPVNPRDPAVTHQLRDPASLPDALLFSHGLAETFDIRFKTRTGGRVIPVDGYVVMDLMARAGYLRQFPPEKFRAFTLFACSVGEEAWPDGPLPGMVRRLRELGDPRPVFGPTDVVWPKPDGTVEVEQNGVIRQYPPVGIEVPIVPQQPSPGPPPAPQPSPRRPVTPEPVRPPAATAPPVGEPVPLPPGTRLADVRHPTFQDDEDEISGYFFPIDAASDRKFQRPVGLLDASLFRSFPAAIGEGTAPIRDLPWAGDGPPFVIMAEQTGKDELLVSLPGLGQVRASPAGFARMLIDSGLFNLLNISPDTPIVLAVNRAGADPDNGIAAQIAAEFQGVAGYRGWIYAPTTDINLRDDLVELSDNGYFRAFGGPTAESRPAPTASRPSTPPTDRTPPPDGAPASVPGGHRHREPTPAERLAAALADPTTAPIRNDIDVDLVAMSVRTDRAGEVTSMGFPMEEADTPHILRQMDATLERRYSYVSAGGRETTRDDTPWADRPRPVGVHARNAGNGYVLLRLRDGSPIRVDGPALARLVVESGHIDARRLRSVMLWTWYALKRDAAGELGADFATALADAIDRTLTVFASSGGNTFDDRGLHVRDGKLLTMTVPPRDNWRRRRE